MHPRNGPKKTSSPPPSNLLHVTMALRYSASARSGAMVIERCTPITPANADNRLVAPKEVKPELLAGTEASKIRAMQRMQAREVISRRKNVFASTSHRGDGKRGEDEPGALVTVVVPGGYRREFGGTVSDGGQTSAQHRDSKPVGAHPRSAARRNSATPPIAAGSMQMTLMDVAGGRVRIAVPTHFLRDWIAAALRRSHPRALERREQRHPRG